MEEMLNIDCVMQFDGFNDDIDGMWELLILKFKEASEECISKKNCENWKKKIQRTFRPQRTI